MTTINSLNQSFDVSGEDLIPMYDATAGADRCVAASDLRKYMQPEIESVGSGVPLLISADNALQRYKTVLGGDSVTLTEGPNGEIVINVQGGESGQYDVLNWRRVTTSTTVTERYAAYDVFPGANNVVITLPPPDQPSARIDVWNQTNREYAVIVKDHTGTTLKTLQPVQAYSFYYNETVPAWDAVQLAGNPVVPLEWATYGDFNALAWNTLPSGRYTLTALGSDVSNLPAGFVLQPASVYIFDINHTNVASEYRDFVSFTTTSDFSNPDLGRPFLRAGSDFGSAASVGWRIVGFKGEQGNGGAPVLATYGILRGFSGVDTLVYVAGRTGDQDGAAGVFAVDEADTTSADNDGTVLVDAIGRRWKRQIGDHVSTAWFWDGVADPFQPVKAANSVAASAGVPLVFVEGEYVTAYRDATDEANWIEITASGTEWRAQGRVTLRNFLIYAHGTHGDFVGVGGALESGDHTIPTATAHNLIAGDYVQVLGQYNVYTPDAGVWQNGSQNPTSLDLPACRLSEIHRVSAVNSATSFDIPDGLIFGGYRDNISGLTQPMAGVTTAEVRKLSPVVGVRFVGLTFANSAASSFRCFLARCAVDLSFERCQFEAGGLAGTFVKVTDADGITFADCRANGQPVGASGSSWNYFVIAGGTQNLHVDGGIFVGGQQVFDVTPNNLSGDIGDQSSALRCEYLTTHHATFEGATFVGCSDGFTTHPASYWLTATGNTLNGCNTGIRSRSLGNTITGNQITASAAGISLSAFYDNTLVSGNTITQIKLATPIAFIGISISPMSSEVMNSNNVQNVVISDNVIRAPYANANNWGVQVRHVGNGVPPNPSFSLFTDAIKTGKSNYLIEGNKFERCSVQFAAWCNGGNVTGNIFSGTPDQTQYVQTISNSAAHTIADNLFTTNHPAVSTATVTSPVSWPYTTEHKIGRVICSGGAPTVSLNNLGTLFTYTFGGDVSDGYRVVNGASFSAVRATGSCTMRLDSIASDGTSNVDIRVFDQNTTTGTKTFAVTGRVSSENSYPRSDNVYSSGLSGNRWSVIYAGTGTINTSDAREKQDVRSLDAAEKAVAQVCKSLIRAYRFRDAVESKGDDARIHIGVMAQDVIAAFETEGLNPYSYGIVCRDELEGGEYRLGVRYDELLAFIISSM